MRGYIFHNSATWLFGIAAFLMVIALVCLAMALRPLHHPDDIISRIAMFVIFLFLGWFAIGAALNGIRTSSAWFRVKFSWRR